jgi:hypothetical protein
MLASCLALLITPSSARQSAGWFPLQVPGGRGTLRVLGVADHRERSAVMVELVRRFLFATTSQAALEASLRSLPAGAGDSLVLPLPLAPAQWSSIVFDRTVPASRLFAEILLNPSARLLFHGLAGLDPDTLRWIEGQDDLLRRLYRNHDALKSFALFAPSVRISNGRLDIPGGAAAQQRWPAVIGARPDQPAQFVGRLFEDRAGRTAGLFAIAAFADQDRRDFLLGGTEQRFARLVSSFAQCYPPLANDYPLALRSYDPALLLLDITLDGRRVAGPSSQRFWQRVFDSKELSSAPPDSDLTGDTIDAAGLVDQLCTAPTPDREETFATLLAGPRLFRGLAPRDWPDAVLALRVRRQFPSVFMAMEQAGLRRPAIFAIVGRHALRLDRVNDVDGASVALRQFQGALALTLNATAAHTLDAAESGRLLTSLAAVPFERERYDGGIANWIRREWLPSVVASLRLPPDLTLEQVAIDALAGPPPVNPKRVTWEGVDYEIDFPAAARQRLREVRTRQGGTTLDDALAVSATGSQLAQVLASWAYAPHLGAADGGALVGGDSSARHDLGLRAVNRTRFEQRWAVAPKTGERGAVAGSYVGLVSPLANWSLRRLSSDRIPPPPTINDNELSSLFLTVALSDPAALADDEMARISAAIASGSRMIQQTLPDGDRLAAAARSAGMSPWRVALLPWILAEEAPRIGEQFSLSHRARLGGWPVGEAAPWGTASLSAGCLCLRMPPARIPELLAGRPADGIVAAQSADLMLRIAMLLVELKMPAALASPVLSYAMRDYLDAVRPSHPADFEAFARQAPMLHRTTVEDYLGAIAATGALRPVVTQVAMDKPVNAP